MLLSQETTDGLSTSTSSNIEIGVANQGGIQDTRKQEATESSHRSTIPKLKDIPPKLYPQILYLYFHYLSPFQATPCNGGEIISIVILYLKLIVIK